jgi:hypothetical protein
MRTTVNIDDALLAEAKSVAARTHRSLGSVFEEALRVLLVERAEARKTTASLSLPVGRASSGVWPGVDLEDKEHLAELLEDNQHSDADR